MVEKEKKKRRVLPFRFQCNKRVKKYKRVNWASEHNRKKHDGKAKFKILGKFKENE